MEILSSHMGVVFKDIKINCATEEEISRIYKAVLEHKIVCFKDQIYTYDEYVSFAK
ncbi:hypothetical protein GCM10027514_02010 [Azotobacter armeniacus]